MSKRTEPLKQIPTYGPEKPEERVKIPITRVTAQKSQALEETQERNLKWTRDFGEEYAFVW